MSKSKFDKDLLEQKKNKVIEIVNRICIKRNLPIPYINFEGCSEEDQFQLAHYHSDINRICISERQLIKQNFEDIIKTTVHEVSHINVQDHSGKFYDDEEISSITNFQPGPGVVHINKKIEIDNKPIKIKIDKIRCNYHLCRKKTILKKCKFCENYFCKEHIKPSEPQVGNYGNSPIKSHPCPPYVDYLIKEKEIQNERYGEALAKITSNKRRQQPKSYDYDKEYTRTPTSIEPEYEEVPFRKRRYKLSKNLKKVVAVLLIIVIVVLISLFYKGMF